jgi:uncharacterized protein YidB (DUF937 family)
MLTHAMRGVIGTDTSPGPGLPWLLETLEKTGLGDQVRSWSAPGEAMPISGAHLHAALGDAEVRAMSGRAGLQPDEFVAKLSEHLPGVVRELWRAGKLPVQARAG